MRLLRSLPLVAVALSLSACRQPTAVRVDRQYGIDGAWQVPKQGPTLDASGPEVTLQFKGRFFAFELEKFRGYIDTDEISLYGDGVRIEMDKERVKITRGKQVVEKKLEELPKNRRILYVDGELIVE